MIASFAAGFASAFVCLYGLAGLVQRRNHLKK
jgi:hypothetical protein